MHSIFKETPVPYPRLEDGRVINWREIEEWLVRNSPLWCETEKAQRYLFLNERERLKLAVGLFAHAYQNLQKERIKYVERSAPPVYVVDPSLCPLPQVSLWTRIKSFFTGRPI